MRQPPHVYYLIPRTAIEHLPVNAVLDMLRFDAATIECNAPPGFYLLSNTHGPERARWASFGVSTIHGPYRDTGTALEAARRLSRPSDTTH